MRSPKPSSLCLSLLTFRLVVPSSQAGDSFDLAVALTSLLIGVGYNAYVVVGYAPDAVVFNDQSRTVCPLIVSDSARR